MFVAPGLVYLELQKTGGTHLRRLFEQYTGGKTAGKHNRLPAGYSDNFIIGSIRNPWDWYVSLWAYGVGGKGAVRARTTRGIDINYYHRLLPRAMGKNYLAPAEWLVCLYHDALKPVEKWRHTYDNADEPELFRRWLKLLLDHERRFDMGEGYGFSPVSRHAGLLGYRYFRLFTSGDNIYTDKRLSSVDGFYDYDREHNITSGMIKTESLEEDFIRVLEESGHTFTEEQLDAIRNKEEGKTNVSERNSASYYYDDETAALVAERERYLIEKYDYVAPV